MGCLATEEHQEETPPAVGPAVLRVPKEQQDAEFTWGLRKWFVSV